MSHMQESAGSSTLTDKEIAEDILTGKKYLSNYYYAPAVLETSDPSLRNTFQQVHNDAQSEAKRIFDYLSERGYYKPKPADVQDMNDLKNTVQESQQTVTRITGQTNSQQGGQHQMNQYGSTPQGNQFQGQGNQMYGYPQGGNYYQTNRYAQTGQWVGDQIGEGQSGMGPSSLSQGAKWGGQPSWNQQQGQGISQNYGRQFFTGQNIGQQQLGNQQNYSQNRYNQTGQWVGDQIGEGQSGMGPSSLAQGAHWGGQPSWIGQNVSQAQRGQNFGQQNLGQQNFGQQNLGQQNFGQQNLGGQNLGQQNFAHQGFGQQNLDQQNLRQQNLGQQYFNTGQNIQPRSGQWVGDQIGEGQSGMGPSSLSQGAKWGGQPSWNM